MKMSIHLVPGILLTELPLFEHLPLNQSRQNELQISVLSVSQSLVMIVHSVAQWFHAPGNRILKVDILCTRQGLVKYWSMKICMLTSVYIQKESTKTFTEYAMCIEINTGVCVAKILPIGAFSYLPDD